MRTVIFGGAFDPPHKEHVRALGCAVKAIGAERAVILPTFLPPHKSEGFLDFDTRAELARIAFKGAAPEVVVDDIERRRGKDNYAYLVIREMKKKYGDVVYLVGGDSLRDIGTWKCPEELLHECPLIVAPREGAGDAEAQRASVLEKYGGEILLLDFMGKGMSSGRVKAELLLGMDCDEVPEAVLGEIKRRGLFRDYADDVEKLKGMQTEELFEHSVAAVMRAVDLNSRHNLARRRPQLPSQPETGFQESIPRRAPARQRQAAPLP